jgi:two-component sensor histidine kinase
LIAALWERLSTGAKMLAILSLGLLPLGIIAVLASIDNVRENRSQARVESQALLAVHVQRFTLALLRNAATIRAARDAISEGLDPSRICLRTLDRLSRLPIGEGRYVLFGDRGQPRCATPGFLPTRMPTARGQPVRSIVTDDRLQIFLFDGNGTLEGVAEYPRPALARVIDTPASPGDFALELVQGGRVMPLRSLTPAGERSRQLSALFPFAGGDYGLRIRFAERPTTVAQVLIILTPVLMWLWASLVGWILVQRLLLGPLGRLQSVVSAYKPGDTALDLPRLQSPAREIGALGSAFDTVIRTVVRHEAELEAAVERQKRLVREVHHRVKNNLQVVASLLNLHSRGAKNEDVAAAYASIQRRVDALAVVHRNHYAELEENRGVALRPLISELAANLRATAPPDAVAMQIRLDIAPVHATQDVAVSVAFLVTEISEFGMLCGATQVSIVLDKAEGGSARLTIEVDSLAGERECEPAVSERFERIVIGLSRQLRSELERDPARGRYSLAIAVVPESPPPA